jgi:hypothetical protein
MTTTAGPRVADDQQHAAARGAAGDGWRRWRTPLVIIAIILAGAAVVALIRPAGPLTGYLNPASTGPTGTRALADLLAGRGQQVQLVSTPAAASAAAGQGAGTLVVTSPAELTRGQLRLLATARANLVIVQPDQAALAALAPGVTIAGSTGIGPVQPGCGLTAARLAGNAEMGGTTLRLHPGVAGTACYPAGGLASLVRYTAGTRNITVLGTGAPLENQDLASLGDAALAVNLLRGSQRIAWLVPGQAIAAGTGPKPVASLIPLGAYLVAIQLGIAVLLAALWRARRLGPLVTERLPVVVRASETAEGHARLYLARRARDKAAETIRAAAVDRLVPYLGLPRGATPEAITAALAARSRLQAARVTQLLFGPPPASDDAMVRLADDLDAMEREVRAQ